MERKKIVIDPMKQKRWYDAKPELAQSVDLLASFPEQIQTIVAKGIIQLAEQECNAREVMNSLKSLGAETILGIYKSKNKRRPYDSNPAFHQAMVYLYILTPASREFMARQIIQLVDYIREYFATCNTFHSAPSAEVVSKVTEAFLANQNDDVEKFLKMLEERFNQAVSSAPVLVEGVSEDGSGMRVSQEEGERRKGNSA
ncbi:MAG: hypothetical protein AB7P76_04530 [Candidatus Melainabacteria bacterium]